jgi:hypothetical protein
MSDDAFSSSSGHMSRGVGLSRKRLALFAFVVAASLAAAAGYVVHAMRQLRGPSTPRAASAAAAGPCRVEGQAWPRADCAEPHVVFRNVERVPNEQVGVIALASLESSASARFVTPLSCLRIHVAAGKGLCVDLDDAVRQKVDVHLLGADLKPSTTLSLIGLPSRVRVSPDGRYGAVTLFRAGHAYSDGDMSTLTVIIDMVGNGILGDLEKFQVLRDGAPFEAPDFNFWGVTFTRDPGRFYATLASGGKTWLVEGGIAGRRLRTLRENVECPSISPDGKRLAFKKRVGGPGAWRLHLLDLATLEEKLLVGEERSIDDQAEWLDDTHVIYGHGPDIYELDITATAPARVLLAQASSPAVVHPSR